MNIKELEATEKQRKKKATAVTKGIDILYKLSISENLSVMDYFVVITNLYCRGIINCAISEPSQFSDHDDMIKQVKEESNKAVAEFMSSQIELIKEMFNKQKGEDKNGDVV